MEVTAVIEALKNLKYPCSVKLYSDSAYVVNCFKQGWIFNWRKNGWKNASKEPVKIESYGKNYTNLHKNIVWNL